MQNKLKQSAELQNLLAKDKVFLDSLESARNTIVKSLENRGKLMTCGRFAFDRPALPAISLYDLATTTAVGNDYGYEGIFFRFVESLGGENDVLFSISTSGNSGNCLKAMESAKKKGVKNIALLGNDGGKMKNLADAAIIIPSRDIPLIQEIHLMAIHWICEEVEKYFFSKS